MSKSVSVVINTLNEEANLENAIKSVKWADEIVVCDMYSEDNTVHIAKKNKAKVVFHKKTNFVEPARNFAISQASGDWILVLDADEEISSGLAEKLQIIIKQEDGPDYVEVPRKNIIFGKWMQYSGWWPDYNIRLFKKGFVVWKNEIHSKPEAEGRGYKLAAQEGDSIIHHHYDNIRQYISRMDRYTSIQAEELESGGYHFTWHDLITKPLGEFLSRYFAHTGYKDGVHGLILSLLQAFSHLVMYIKIWELQKYPDQNISLSEFSKVAVKSGYEVKYWLRYSTLSANKIKRTIQRIAHKII